MAEQKVSTGQKLKESPLRKARVVNLLLDASARHQRTELSAVNHPPRGAPRSTDVVIVQNITGAARERGDVVQLGEYLCSGDPDIFDPWFEGKEPADPLWKCAILGEPAAEDGFARAHASGVCVAKVDVQSTSDTHAAPVDGEYVLRSAAGAGPLEILSPATGTGEQLMAVRFAGGAASFKEGRLDADLTPNGTATVSIFVDGSDTGEDQEHVSTWVLRSGFKLAAGNFVIIGLFGEKWRVTEARECPVPL